MIKILEGNDFLIQEYLKQFIDSKLKDLTEVEKKYSIIKNPLSLSVVTNVSGFSSDERIIIWEFDSFKKLEKFDPYVIPRKTDIFIIGKKIDKRLTVVKELEGFNAEWMQFKDLYPNQIEGWILQRKQKMKLNIASDAIKQLAFLYGNNLLELSNQLDNLKKLNVPITKEIVFKTSTAVNQFTIFELQDFITAGNFSKANYVVKQMLKNGEEAFGLIRYLNTYFEKVIIVRLNDPSMVEDLKLHSFALKKMREVRISVEYCQKALDYLRLAEQRILQKFPIDYVMSRLLFNLTKVK